MTTGIWTPRRVPLLRQALSVLPDAARARFERQFTAPTDVQKHIWFAAARSESLVLVAPRASGTQLGLRIAAEILNGTIETQTSAGVRVVSLCAANATLIVTEPHSRARDHAVRVASQHGRCGFADITPYASIRTRVFAPFRNEPNPDVTRTAAAWQNELSRMAENGRQISLFEAGARGAAPEFAEESAFTDGWANSAVVSRAAAASDGPFHAHPAVALFAANWRQALLAHVVASRVRAGKLDSEDQNQTDSSRIAEEWIERVRRSNDTEERQAYALVSAFAMNRGNAIAIVRGAKA